MQEAEREDHRHQQRVTTYSYLKITCTHTTNRIENPNLTINEIVIFPLSSQPLWDEYVGKLKQLSGHGQLTEMSEISITSDGNYIGRRVGPVSRRRQRRRPSRPTFVSGASFKQPGVGTTGRDGLRGTI